MAAQNSPLSIQEIGLVSMTSLQSTFDRLALMRRGNQPHITTAQVAQATSQKTKLQITDQAIKAITAQAKIDMTRACKLLETVEGIS